MLAHGWHYLRIGNVGVTSPPTVDRSAWRWIWSVVLAALCSRAGRLTLSPAFVEEVFAMARPFGQLASDGAGTALSGGRAEWEHRVRRVCAAAWADGDDASLAAALDEEARDGWELVGVASVARSRRSGGMTAFGPDKKFI